MESMESFTSPSAMFNPVRGSEQVACTVKIIITITEFTRKAYHKPSMMCLVKLQQVFTVVEEPSVVVRQTSISNLIP